MSSVKIYLDKLDSVEVCKGEELIFHRQHDALVDKIRRTAERNKRTLKRVSQEDAREHENTDSERGRGMPHCFFIDGSRGSGKSTLLRAVRESLVMPPSEGSTARICSLADVDPTELGTEENFFMYLLGRIYKKLDSAYSKVSHSDQEVQRFREAMGALRDMSSGLCMLMGNEAALKNADMDEFFLENAIEKCADSTLLRQKLSVLLEKTCRIVNADVFLVTVDDADLNFSKCEDVLEFIRKYMQSPRLIFLFAGDMRLYSHVVRGLYMQSFEKRLLKYDESHRVSRNKLLDQLEEQYLVKMFPMVNRVNMGSFNDVLNSPNKVYLWQDKAAEQKCLSENGEKQEDALLRTMLNHILDSISHDSQERRVLVALMGTLPLRSALFLMHDWIEATRSAAKGEAAYVQVLADGVQKAAEQVLVKNNVDYDTLRHADARKLLETVFLHLAEKQGVWNSDASLLPSGVDTELSMVTWYLNLMVQAATAPLYAKLDYFCTLFPHWERIGVRCRSEIRRYAEPILLHRVTRSQLSRALQFNEQDGWGATTTACMVPRVRSGSNWARRFGNGTVRLMKDPQHWNMQNGRVERASLAATLRVLSSKENLEDEKKAMFCLGVYHALCCLVDGKETSFYLSVYNLLSFASKLLRLGWEYRGDEKSLREMVAKELKKGRDVPQAEIHDIAEEENEEESEIRNRAIPTLYTEKVEEAICNWVVKFTSADELLTSSGMLWKWWILFLRSCAKNTEHIVMRTGDESQFPRALSLLQAYMRSVTEAANDACNEFSMEAASLSQCIAEFPLWAALMEAEQKTKPLFDAVNAANIGPLSHAKLVEAYSEIERAYAQADEAWKTAQKERDHLAEEVKESTKRKVEAEKKNQGCQETLRKLADKKGKQLETIAQQADELKRLQHDYRNAEESLKSMGRKISDMESLLANLNQHREMLAMSEMRLRNRVSNLKTEARAIDKNDKKAKQASDNALLRAQQEIQLAQRSRKEVEGNIKNKKAEVALLKKQSQSTGTEMKRMESAISKAVQNEKKLKAGHELVLEEYGKAEREMKTAEKVLTMANARETHAWELWEHARKRTDKAHASREAAQKKLEKATNNDLKLIESILK